MMLVLSHQYKTRYGQWVHCSFTSIYSIYNLGNSNGLVPHFKNSLFPPNVTLLYCSQAEVKTDGDWRMLPNWSRRLSMWSMG